MPRRARAANRGPVRTHPDQVGPRLPGLAEATMPGLGGLSGLKLASDVSAFVVRILLWPLRASSKSARGPSAVAESMITVITGAWPPSRTDPPRAHGGLAQVMIGVRRPDLVVARARREINVAGFAFRSSGSWLLPQSQLTAGHHRSRRDGLTAEEAPHKKEFHSHAVGHSRRS